MAAGRPDDQPGATLGGLDALDSDDDVFECFLWRNVAEVFDLDIGVS